jgi:hypothetical protein
MRPRYNPRDGNEPALVKTIEALSGFWVQGPPFDGWMWGRGACATCGAHGWRLSEVKQPEREGAKHEFTKDQLKLIIRLNERQIPWYPLRTEDDVFRLLGARRTA